MPPSTGFRASVSPDTKRSLTGCFASFLLFSGKTRRASLINSGVKMREGEPQTSTPKTSPPPSDLLRDGSCWFFGRRTVRSANSELSEQPSSARFSRGSISGSSSSDCSQCGTISVRSASRNARLSGMPSYRKCSRRRSRSASTLKPNGPAS